MKIYGEVEVQLHGFLTSALEGGEQSASHPCHFTPRERASSTQWISGCVGHRASLDVVVKTKIPAPAKNQTLLIQPLVQSFY